jgi:hypothetical protein
MRAIRSAASRETSGGGQEFACVAWLATVEPSEDVRMGSGRAGYGTKIMPLGVSGPMTVTLLSAPVVRLIVPRELAG